MASEILRLVPDYYRVSDLHSHSGEQQITEQELRIRATRHFELSESDLEKLLNGEVVESSPYRIEPGFVDTFNLTAD
ncbi:hypothetical protein HHX48_16005 [Salinimonas sp. HHU 13199]|uniref:Uncharacterized protein n=1 Tax=Salinimonas profundi TaxID=2729140 RepID=A0ABR8LTE4_9ALTE|nr:hypothetical protein [Salinimonas profundi]MBD3587244.1 hypothetical protein [Salinimonas profundi]